MRDFLLIIVFISSLYSCDDPNEKCCNDQVEVVLGESFSLAVDQVVSLENSIISVKFVEVHEDSLCPDDVVCVRQGRFEMGITINNSSKKVSLGENETPTASILDYQIELEKLIYPINQQDKANGHATYAVQMVITKN